MSDLEKELAELGQRTVEALEELHRRVDELERPKTTDDPNMGRMVPYLEVVAVYQSGVADERRRKYRVYAESDIEASRIAVESARDDALEEAAKLCWREADATPCDITDKELRRAARLIRALKSTKQ